MTEEPDLTISRQNEPSAASDRHVVNRWAGRGATHTTRPVENPWSSPENARLLANATHRLARTGSQLGGTEAVREGRVHETRSACFQGSRGMVGDVPRPLREIWERARQLEVSLRVERVLCRAPSTDNRGADRRQVWTRGRTVCSTSWL